MSGASRLLIDACVGSGKSLTIAMLGLWAKALGWRVLTVTHVRELVEQVEAAGKAVGLQVGVNAASLGRRDWRGQFIVAAIQSVFRNARSFGPIDLLIIDEVHMVPHGDMGMYRQLIRDLGVERIVGLTGTPFRLNGGSLITGEGALFERIVYTYSILDGIRDGYLVPAFSATIEDKIDASKLKISQGEFTGSSQDAQMIALMDSHLAQLHVLGADRKRWLIFEASTKAAKAMTKRMNEWGIPTGLVLGTTPHAERAATIAAYRQGRLRALVNCLALTTGFDVQEVDLLVMRRRTMSLGLYVQMCLDAETEILTENGWRRYDTIRDDDQVAGFDLARGTIEWCPILSRVERPLATGERMFGVKSPHLDIRVTDQHDMILRATSGTSKNWQKEPAASTAKRLNMVRIPVAGSGSNGVPANLTDDEIRLVGWYLTDGTIGKDNNALIIAQSDSKPAHCAEIRRVMRSCGLKFREYAPVRKGAQVQYAPCRRFTVSKGIPRGEDKHLRGWAHLESWFDKTLGTQFESLDDRQFLILIQAMWLGDGANGNVPSDYKKHTFSITCGDNKVYADRLQSLCVRRGFRCNIAFQQQKPSAWNANPKLQYMVYIKQVRTSTIAGVNDKDGVFAGKKPYKRSRFAEVPHSTGEIVWCVENRLGTIVTRRNGKVAIVGNCGRGLRTIGGNIEASIAAGKADCLVCDYAGNIDAHGALDFLRPKDTPSRFVSCESCRARVPAAAMKCWSCDEPMTKNCPACLEPIRKGLLDCPLCGHDMRVGGDPASPTPQRLLERPSGAALIASYKTGSAREGGWLPVRWVGDVGGALTVATADSQHVITGPLQGYVDKARWVRVGVEGQVDAILVPNGTSRNSVLQVTIGAAGVVQLPVPMPSQKTENIG